MADCSSAESVLESMALIRANGQKIDKFTNGSATETVQLGTGAPTPVLRHLVSDVREALQGAVDSIVPAGEAVAITSVYIDSLFD